MLGDSICLTKKRLDPSAINHFSGQRLNSVGETTGCEFLFEFVLPCPEIKPLIGSFWVSYPENFGRALDGCSVQAPVNSDPRT